MASVKTKLDVNKGLNKFLLFVMAISKWAMCAGSTLLRSAAAQASQLRC
jgi:hypothetical protein